MNTRVMIVDDEKGIRNVLKIYLQDAGYEVMTAGGGKKAAGMLEHESFDIVMTDIRMPGMDGISLLKLIKEKFPDTQVIMITGHGDYKLAIESLKLDAIDFIPKPIENDVLDIALKRAHDRIDTRRKISDYTNNLETLVAQKTRKLAESEKRYLSLFNESPGYLTIQDKDLTIIETNRVFKQDFNFREGMKCYEAYKTGTSPCADCPVHKTFRDGNSHTIEMDVKGKGGRKRNIYIQTSPITDETGRITHVMEMSTDITMIRELQDHLATLGLHISSVSHGLKQLLTGLDSGTYLIESGLDKNDNQQISEGWEIVKEKILKTRQMVLNILFHAKKRKPDRSRVPVAELLKEVVASITPRAQKESVELKVDFTLGDIVLNLDKMALFAAFTSILENAVEACRSKKKGARINFSARVTVSHIIFIIRDNGKGLAKNKKDKIFNLFYSDKGSKGTGLGLFIASRSIRQHGGTIGVDSELNRYTEFKVTLPIQAGVETDSP